MSKVKLKAKETPATNSDFYNLFRPIAPSIDVIGKVAQVISGLTEAVTIWYITQSEMAGSSKVISILVSILAMILVVALLELGGRKFLQVITRALVWNRLKNAWYIGLFAVVFLITTGIGVLSFRLSTKGINHAFVSNVPIGKIFDDSALKSEYHRSVKEINGRFDHDLEVIKESHKEMMSGVTTQFDTRINAADQKVKEYDHKFAQGHKWAKSQGDKYRKEVAQLETEKATGIMGFQKDYSKKLDLWQGRKTKAIEVEKTSLLAAVTKGEDSLNKVQDSRFKNATFWGGLFSVFVGFSVILAFTCIISVEVYRRGSGIEVKYREETMELSVFVIFWKGLIGRIDAFFRRKAENFAKISTPQAKGSRIGFDFPSALPVNSVDKDLPN
ncbi:MAG: hypothetical protein GY705_25570 [Bacteroidetes bacterium]|nr:hypothetical protein [Bacteroidota bacterium]